ncbi:hypothetical protein AGMMS50255_2780 [Spirochaetia bacterium]|nr:hypothetical protein AGMMS50255_2780 [Spirochaetia bacterium]
MGKNGDFLTYLLTQKGGESKIDTFFNITVKAFFAVPEISVPFAKIQGVC